MSRLDRETDVIRMASELSVDIASPVNAITRFCRQKLDRICSKCGASVTNVAQLQTLVCQHLRLVFEYVRTDKDLDCVTKKYVAMHEFGFAALKCDLDPDTFATLLERRHVDASASDRYVAVIDCRGPEKSSRQYFTQWHEIAHLFTLTRQLELPFHRSTRDRDPIERLMDVIAGEIGFYDPLIKPAIKAEVAQSTRLTFSGVERIRAAVCPDASYRATLNACVQRVDHPVVLLEAGMGYKKAELAQLRSKQLTLVPVESPKAQLRVLSFMANNSARGSEIRVDKNMRVPPTSLVARHFRVEAGLESIVDLEEPERLNIWRHSSGNPVSHAEVWVNSRRLSDRVLALFQPITPKRRSPKDSSGEPARRFEE